MALPTRLALIPPTPMSSSLPPVTIKYHSHVHSYNHMQVGLTHTSVVSFMLLSTMDWRHYSPLLHSAEDETHLSLFNDANFPLDSSLFSPPHSYTSDLFLDPLPPPALAASDSLPSPHLPTCDLVAWPSVTSPPSPTASTTSVSSSSSSSFSSTSSLITHHPTPTPTPTPTFILPATLAVSPDLLRKLHCPPPTATPTNQPTTTTTTRQQRKRAVGLTTQQRAELKRQKHREIDANRIQREKAAVKRLTSLTNHSNPPYTPIKQEEKAGEAEEAEEEEEEAAGGRRDKVTVLEDSAKRIDELQRLVSRLTDACNVQQANNRALIQQLQSATRQPPPHPSSSLSSASASSHPLSLLPSSVAQQLDGYVGSTSLHSSWFVSSTVSIAVVRCSTGCILDVNERHSYETGLSRNRVIGRLLCPPYDYIISPHTYTQQRFDELSKQRILIDGPDGRLVPARTQRQYSRSKQAIRALYEGEKQNIFCVFRHQMKDGRVYEVKSAIWTVSWVEEEEGEGSSGGDVGVVRKRRPDSIFVVCSYSDAVCVDDAPLC